MYRLIRIKLVDGDEDFIELDEAGIRQLFEQYMLPVPNMQKPVLSTQLRECVFKFGINMISKDSDDFGEVRCIAPSQIKDITFQVWKEEPTPEKKTKTKRFLKG